MVDVQTIGVLVTAASVSVAAIYYIFTLRNTSKTHELQVFMQVFDRFNNPDFWDQLDDMMKREWTSIDDYEKKYSGGGGNVVFPTLEGLGVLLKRRLIDASVPWDLFGNYLFLFWDKYIPIIEARRGTIGPDFSIWTEYLVREVRKYAAENHESLMLSKSS